MRTVPYVPEPPPATPQIPGVLSRVFDFRVITPLFGGGAETRVNDPVTLVRPSSIRGHLRFWWRATVGAESCKTVEELRKAESKIWGSTENPSPVWLEVTSIAGKAGDFPPAPELSYALFPFQANRQQPQANGSKGVAFQLKISFPSSVERDVMTSLKAWANLGGIGARTRRGCGAVFCAQLAPANVNQVRDALKDLIHARPRAAWPSLYLPFLWIGPAGDPVQAWSNGVGTLKTFRQMPGFGRDPGAGRTPGRSRFPEPDSLRSITGKGVPAHLSSNTIRDPSQLPAFPRAEFGLPLIFHFHPHQPDDHPNNSTLSAGDKERMGSPLILRPLGVGNGSQAVPMAVLLSFERPTTLKLEFKAPSRIEELPGSCVRGPHLMKGPKYPNSPMGKSQSALDAFLNFLAARPGYQVVKFA